MIMLMLCPLHGPQPAIMISRDLWVSGESPCRLEEIVDLIYTFEGKVAWAFYVSRQFAIEHGLTGQVSPLPDEPGEWARILDCCCSKCFQAAHGGHFDELKRWKPDGVV
jgi:hypothetical protein